MKRITAQIAALLLLCAPSYGFVYETVTGSFSGSTPSTKYEDFEWNVMNYSDVKISVTFTNMSTTNLRFRLSAPRNGDVYMDLMPSNWVATGTTNFVATIDPTNYPNAKQYFAEFAEYSNGYYRVMATGKMQFHYSTFGNTENADWDNPLAGTVIGPPIHTISTPYSAWPFLTAQTLLHEDLTDVSTSQHHVKTVLNDTLQTVADRGATATNHIHLGSADTPATQFHVTAPDHPLGLTTADMPAFYIAAPDDYAVMLLDGEDAWMCIASEYEGGHGSTISLWMMQTNTFDFVDSWDIGRFNPSFGENAAFFSYGTNTDYASNGLKFAIYTNGNTRTFSTAEASHNVLLSTHAYIHKETDSGTLNIRAGTASGSAPKIAMNGSGWGAAPNRITLSYVDLFDFGGSIVSNVATAYTTGTNTAAYFVGDGSGLTAIPAAQLTGDIAIARMTNGLANPGATLAVGGELTIQQPDDVSGLTLYGSSDPTDYGEIWVDSSGRLNIDSHDGHMYFLREGVTKAYIDNYGVAVLDDALFHAGSSSDDISLGWYSSDSTFRIIHGNDLSANVRMLIATNGNLSIGGTNAPSEKLHVAGNAIVTTNLTVGGDVEAGGVGIGTSPGIAALDISNGAYTMLIGADQNAKTRTDSAAKTMRMGIPHYLAAEEPVAVLYGVSSAADSLLFFGGATSLYNAPTKILFYTAADTTTVTGTEQLSLTSAGATFATDLSVGNDLTVAGNAIVATNMTVGADLDVVGDVGIGTNAPDTELDLNGILTLREATQAADPDAGASQIWMSDGNGAGLQGDIMSTVNVGGTIKTNTVVQFTPDIMCEQSFMEYSTQTVATGVAEAIEGLGDSRVDASYSTTATNCTITTAGWYDCSIHLSLQWAAAAEGDVYMYTNEVSAVDAAGNRIGFDFDAPNVAKAENGSDQKMMYLAAGTRVSWWIKGDVNNDVVIKHGGVRVERK